MSAAHFNRWDDYQTFARTVRFSQRYIRPPQVESFLEAVRHTALSRVSKIQKGWNKIWRAQIGYCERDAQDGSDLRVPSAYPPHRMKPRDRMGREGRVNAKGIPCFYGATTPETAMSEVRPWMGSLISIGRFEAEQDIQIVDCSKYHKRNPWHWLLATALGVQPTPGEIEEAVWTHIDHAFSEPVTDSDELPDYVPTQILAELFKADGYDGIAYKSTLTENGYNLAFFNPNALRQVQGELFRTSKVQFEFAANPDDQYYVQNEDTVVRNVIVDIKPAETK